MFYCTTSPRDEKTFRIYAVGRDCSDVVEDTRDFFGEEDPDVDVRMIPNAVAALVARDKVSIRSELVVDEETGFVRFYDPAAGVLVGDSVGCLGASAGSLRYVRPDGVKWSLDELQKAVGGFVEIIPFEVDGFLLVVNEDGRRLGLPPNLLAKSLFGMDLRGPVLAVPSGSIE